MHGLGGAGCRETAAEPMARTTCAVPERHALLNRSFITLSSLWWA